MLARQYCAKNLFSYCRCQYHPFNKQRLPKLNKKTLHLSLTELAGLDTDIAREHARIGSPAPRNRPQGFATLLSTIVSQQLSTKAANTIYTRVEALLGDVTPAALLALDEAQLRSAGMSGRKTEYATGLARAIEDGSFRLDELPGMDTEEAIEHITTVRGFGRWSAEIYCMFSLQRDDIFPADDLALLVALVGLKKLEQRPTAKQARELVAHWSPWRSAGSLFLWHWYHDDKIAK